MSRRLLALLPVLAACGPRPTYVEAPVRAAVTVTPGTAALTWEKGLNAQTTLVARSVGGSVTPTQPTDGGMVGDGLGAGVIIAITEDTSFTDTKLPDTCGPFSWDLWSQAADGTWAKSAATVRSQKGEHTIAPTAQVTALSSVFEGANVRLAWQPPEASTSFDGVVVLRKRGSAPTNALDGTVVYSGPSSSTTDAQSNLSPTEPTYYAVYNCNTCGKCGEQAPSLAITAPADGGTGLAISGLTASLSADGQQVQLTWTSSAPSIKLLRTVNAAPVGPGDSSAVVLLDGAGTGARERLGKLLPDTPLDPHRYTYTAWGCIAGTCSTTPASTPFTVTVRQALRGGGYVLLFNHATATTCADALSLGRASTTTSPNWWKRCDATCATATAAQLTSPAADDELSAVRGFFADAGVQVSRWQASEFCRAQQTAQGLQLDGGIIEPVQALTYFVYDESRRCNDTVSLLNGAPTAGTNSVLVGHAQFTGSCAVLGSLNPAEAALYKPALGAPAKYVTRVLPSQWATLP